MLASFPGYLVHFNVIHIIFGAISGIVI